MRAQVSRGEPHQLRRGSPSSKPSSQKRSRPHHGTPAVQRRCGSYVADAASGARQSHAADGLQPQRGAVHEGRRHPEQHLRRAVQGHAPRCSARRTGPRGGLARAHTHQRSVSTAHGPRGTPHPSCERDAEPWSAPSLPVDERQQRVDCRPRRRIPAPHARGRIHWVRLQRPQAGVGVRRADAQSPLLAGGRAFLASLPGAQPGGGGGADVVPPAGAKPAVADGLLERDGAAAGRVGRQPAAV